MDIQGDMPDSAQGAKQLLGILSCEPPNSDLHNFIGNFAYLPKAGEPPGLGPQSSRYLCQDGKAGYQPGGQAAPAVREHCKKSKPCCPVPVTSNAAG